MGNRYGFNLFRIKGVPEFFIRLVRERESYGFIGLLAVFGFIGARGFMTPKLHKNSTPVPFLLNYYLINGINYKLPPIQFPNPGKYFKESYFLS